MKIMWFVSGVTAGIVSLSLSFASVPTRVTDDTAIYQKLSEIRISKEAQINFDSDLSRLSQMENHYQERLPALRAPMKRISQQKYQYTVKQPTPVAQQ